jgi:hypothetical protein
VVHGGADDDHGAAVGLFGVGRKLARDLDDLVAGDTCDLLGPGRRVRRVLVVGFRDVATAEAAIDAIVGDEQVVDGRDQRLAVGELQPFHGQTPLEHAGVIGMREVLMRDIAEVREGDVGEFVPRFGE